MGKNRRQRRKLQKERSIEENKLKSLNDSTLLHDSYYKCDNYLVNLKNFNRSYIEHNSVISPRIFFTDDELNNNSPTPVNTPLSSQLKCTPVPKSNLIKIVEISSTPRRQRACSLSISRIKLLERRHSLTDIHGTKSLSVNGSSSVKPNEICDSDKKSVCGDRITSSDVTIIETPKRFKKIGIRLYERSCCKHRSLSSIPKLHSPGIEKIPLKSERGTQTDNYETSTEKKVLGTGNILGKEICNYNLQSASINPVLTEHNVLAEKIKSPPRLGSNLPTTFLHQFSNSRVSTPNEKLSHICLSPSPKASLSLNCSTSLKHKRVRRDSDIAALFDKRNLRKETRSKLATYLIKLCNWIGLKVKKGIDSLTRILQNARLESSDKSNVSKICSCEEYKSQITDLKTTVTLIVEQMSQMTNQLSDLKSELRSMHSTMQSSQKLLYTIPDRSYIPPPPPLPPPPPPPPLPALTASKNKPGTNKLEKLNAADNSRPLITVDDIRKVKLRKISNNSSSIGRKSLQPCVSQDSLRKVKLRRAGTRARSPAMKSQDLLQILEAVDTNSFHRLRKQSFHSFDGIPKRSFTFDSNSLINETK